MSTITPSRKKTSSSSTTPSSSGGSMIKRVSAGTPSSTTRPSPSSRGSSSSPHQTANGSSNNNLKKIEEQQCLLRVPPELANRINKILQQHDASKDANKQIELDIDIVFGDNEEILQFLKSAMKQPQQQQKQKQQQQQQQQNQDTNNNNNITTPATTTTTTTTPNKQATNGATNNKNDEIDQGYISDVEYTIKKNRRGRFRFAQEQYPCELLDLPCIVEAYKSIDCQTYYKAGDVSQMIIVKTPETVDKEMRKLKQEDDEMKKNIALKKVAKKNKKNKKLRKRLLTVSEHGLTPSTRNIWHHWEEQNIDVTKDDIALMVDQFMKMMEEEDPNNVTIEILEDKDEEETFSDDTSSSEEDSDSDTDTSDSEDEDSDRDEEEMAALFGQSSNPPTQLDNQVSSMVASPSVSTPSMLGMKEQSNLSEDSLSAQSDDDDTASVASSSRSGGINFATALARSGTFSSPMFGSPLDHLSTPGGITKSPSSIADDDAKSTITSDEEDEEMFESVMNEESNQMEDDEEEEDSVSSPVSEATTTASTVDRHRLIERRNALLGELAEKQRELAEKERHYVSIPNAILKQRFAGQITEKQKEIEQKRMELEDIDRQLS